MSPPKQHGAAIARGGAQTPQGLPKCHETASRRFPLNYSKGNRRCKTEKFSLRRRTNVVLVCATSSATSANGVYVTVTVIAAPDLLPWLVARRRLRR